MSAVASVEKEWLSAWFKARGTLSGDGLLDGVGRNYFDQGLVDSLGVIELITDIESHFGVAFTEKHFQDRRFSTVDGLVEIIQSLKTKVRGA